MSRVVVFMPLYNEAAHFPELLAEVRNCEQFWETLLIVNNGSTDGSEKMARDTGYPVLEISKNLGVGYSYMQALDWALEGNYDVFVTIAANGKMPPAQIGSLTGPVIRGEVHYAKGSRYLSGGDSPNLPEFRKQAIPWVNRYVRIVTGRALTDATCGFRAFRLDLLRAASFDWHRRWLYTYGMEYYFDAKIMLDKRLSVKEIPVSMRYKAGVRHSKIGGIKDWWAMLRPWLVARADGRGFDHSRLPPLAPLA